MSIIYLLSFNISLPYVSSSIGEILLKVLSVATVRFINLQIKRNFAAGGSLNVP